MILKDRNKTRLKPSAVTSFYPDRKVNSMMGTGSVLPCLKLTIGSCPLEALYDKESDRDDDLKVLDEKVSLD